MRRSTLKTDPDFAPDAYLYQLYLDGQRVEDCVLFDDELGFVEILVRDEDGGLVPSKDGKGCMTIKIRGKVTYIKNKPPGG